MLARCVKLLQLILFGIYLWYFVNFLIEAEVWTSSAVLQRCRNELSCKSTVFCALSSNRIEDNYFCVVA